MPICDHLAKAPKIPLFLFYFFSIDDVTTAYMDTRSTQDSLRLGRLPGPIGYDWGCPLSDVDVDALIG
jgi:hypothetical protein